MRQTIAVLSLVTALACCSPAMAHPGHAVESADTGSLLHYVTHPDHLMWWGIVAIIVAIGIGSAYKLRRKPAPAYARVRKQ